MRKNGIIESLINRRNEWEMAERITELLDDRGEDVMKWYDYFFVDKHTSFPSDDDMSMAPPSGNKVPLRIALEDIFPDMSDKVRLGAFAERINRMVKGDSEIAQLTERFLTEVKYTVNNLSVVDMAEMMVRTKSDAKMGSSFSFKLDFPDSPLDVPGQATPVKLSRVPANIVIKTIEDLTYPLEVTHYFKKFLSYDDGGFDEYQHYVELKYNPKKREAQNKHAKLISEQNQRERLRKADLERAEADAEAARLRLKRERELSEEWEKAKTTGEIDFGSFEEDGTSSRRGAY
jgi:hypothetical protein